MAKFVLGVLLMVWYCLNISAYAEPNKHQTSGFSYNVTPVADWVKVQSVPLTDKSELNHATLSYLLNDEQLDLSLGNYQRYRHTAVKANNKKGAEQISSFELYFSPEYQTLNLHYIRLIRNGVSKDITATSDIRLVQPEQEVDRNIYNGLVAAMILLSDVRTSDIVEYAYTINGTNPVYGDKRFASFATQWGVPVTKVFVRVLTDNNHQLNIRVKNSDDTFTLNYERHQNEHIWQGQNIPAVDDEGQYPGWYSPYTDIQISEFSDWQDVVHWALPLYGSTQLQNAELLALEKNWREESKSKKDYVERIVSYVQNQIRYFGIEVGTNTHEPYSADEIYVRQYGDCKDKTNLMLTLLRRAGIEAYPALVSSYLGESLDAQLASPGAFDHVITYFVLEGKEYWVDGTISQQFGSLESRGEQYFAKALLVKADQTALVDIAAPVLRKSFERSKELFIISDYQTEVKLDTTFQYQGDSAVYYRLALQRLGQSEYEKHLLNYYQRQFPNTELLPGLSIVDDRELNQLQIEAKFKIKQFTNAQNNIELPLFAETLAGYAELPDRVRRNMPLALEPDVVATHTVEYQLPEAIDWQIQDRKVAIESDAIRYSREIELQANSIVVSHSYSSKNNHVPVIAMAEHVKQIKDMREALYFSVAISPDNVSNREKKLRSRFNDLLRKN